MPDQSNNEDAGYRVPDGEGGYRTVHECATCNGSGEYPTDTDLCPDCDGLGEWFE